MWRYLQLICWHDAKADVADVHHIQARVAAIGDHAQVEPYVKVDDVTRRRARAFGGTHIVCVQGQIAGARPSRSYLTQEKPRNTIIP